MSHDGKITNWMKQWNAAQASGVFNDSTKPKQQSQAQEQPITESTYFTSSKKPIVGCDAKYWESLRAKGVIAEQTSKINKDPLGSEPQGKLRNVPGKEPLGAKGAELGNTAQPVEPQTRGEDQRKHVTPEWADGKGLRELVYMKHNLYNLEVKLNSHPKFGAYGEEDTTIKKIQTQIDDLRHKIDELSNSLSPDFVQDELS